MQTYPNYSMNGYNPYQMPMYQQPQPYMDRMAQIQSMQQNLQPQQPAPIPRGMAGRIVEDFNVITANDVPMDGNGAIFIKSDGSEIQVRNWTAQGTIATSRFKPVLEPQTENFTSEQKYLPDELFSAFEAAFAQRFDGLEQRFDKFEKALNKKNKREVSDDE